MALLKAIIIPLVSLAAAELNLTEVLQTNDECNGEVCDLSLRQLRGVADGMILVADPGESLLAVNFTVADGVAFPYGSQRISYLVNGKLGGPLITATEGDIIEVTVMNSLATQGTTIHWHGMYQRDTNFYDGVDGVTQCAIPSREALVYRFKAEPAGTAWWHSHTGYQYADGLSGPLIVRKRTEKQTAKDVVLFLNDWNSVDAAVELVDLTNTSKISPRVMGLLDEGMSMPGMTMGDWGDIADAPWQGILLNGEPLYVLAAQSWKGIANPNIASASPTISDILDSSTDRRLRIICGTAGQMLVVSIPGVKLTVVAIDGQDIKPFGPVEYIQCASGDRIDAIVAAGEAPEPSQALFVQAVNGKFGALGTADSSSKVNLGGRTFWSAAGKCDSSTNAFDNTCFDLMYSRGLEGTVAMPSSANRRVDLKLGGSMSNPYFWYVNDNIFELPQNPYTSFFEADGASARPIVPMDDDNGKGGGGGATGGMSSGMSGGTGGGMSGMSGMSDMGGMSGMSGMGGMSGMSGPKNLTKGSNIIEIKLGDVVDLLIDNVNTMMYHPFHLHGSHFWVLGSGEGSPPSSPPSTSAPVYKDNQNIPAKGWAWLRWKATNPGWWIFHCHIDFHMATGMAVVFKVGSSEEIKESNPLPKGYLKCAERV